MINAAMIQLLLFILSSIVILLLSRRSLRDKGHHGFYRFFAFEAVTFQVVLNLPSLVRRSLCVDSMHFMAPAVLFHSARVFRIFPASKSRGIGNPAR